jgi:hypothetical protein
MSKANSYNKTQAKKFIERTKSGLMKTYVSGLMTNNEFTKMVNELDKIKKRIMK